jgi:hypothetical protein
MLVSDSGVVVPIIDKRRLMIIMFLKASAQEDISGLIRVVKVIIPHNNFLIRYNNCLYKVLNIKVSLRK